MTFLEQHWQTQLTIEMVVVVVGAAVIASALIVIQYRLKKSCILLLCNIIGDDNCDKSSVISQNLTAKTQVLRQNNYLLQKKPDLCLDPTQRSSVSYERCY